MQPKRAVDTSEANNHESVARPEGGVVVPVGHGRSIEVQTTGDKTLLKVRGERKQQLQIEIRFEAGEPVVSVAAATLALENVKNISASCETFAVNASKGIELRSGGDIVQTAAGDARVEGHRVDVQASVGAIRLKANDEVQALGEMILLNCEHPSKERPMPAWVAAGPSVIVETPASQTSGDASVVDELLRG
jgi:hypothetical protein